MSVHRNATVRRRAAIGTALGAAVALTLVGCSSDESPSGTTSADRPAASSPAGSSAPGQSSATAHNDADVEFTTEMIAHHRQAVMMAELVEDRTQNRELITLANTIEDAQEDEIDQMTARLRSWGGVPMGGHTWTTGGTWVTETWTTETWTTGGTWGGPEAAAWAKGGHAGGMMSAAQMAALRNASGAEFDRLWLEGMIRHHEGAIAMADEVLANGTDPATKALATNVKKTQQAEIDQMRAMLGQAEPPGERGVGGRFGEDPEPPPHTPPLCRPQRCRVISSGSSLQRHFFRATASDRPDSRSRSST